MSTARSAAPKLLTFFGIILICIGVAILVRLFANPLTQEVKYLIQQQSLDTKSPTLPVNKDFALVIDKIAANAPVIEDVSPTNPNIYQQALTRGVAHASGTRLPGQDGNIFLFAHSSADLLDASTYNSIFYLMHHLVPQDIIKVWYKGNEYSYVVTDKKIVSPTDLSYLNTQPNSEILTLMTCYPPGTTLKRLIVIAKPLNL